MGWEGGLVIGRRKGDGSEGKVMGRRNGDGKEEW